MWAAVRAASIVGLAWLGNVATLVAAPATPDRPGRPTQDQVGAPPLPTSQPAATSKPVNAGGVAGSDEGLLSATAHEREVATPEQRPDLDILKWFGLRPQLKQDGIALAGTCIADLSRLSQGRNTRTDDFRSLLDVRLNVDARALFNLYGGAFSVDFQNQNGRNGSSVLTGDVQGFDNADADGRTQISELWYQQLLANDKVRVKVGKVDANSEFALATNAVPFINGSIGHAPTIVAMPTYPDPAMGANVFVQPTRHLSASFGIYDGSKAGGLDTGSYGPKNFFTGNGGYFMIAEVGGQWAFDGDTLPGRVAFGGWGSTAHFIEFDGQVQSGTGGEYLVAEQTLWHKRFSQPTDGEGFTSFLQYGHGDPKVSGTQDYLGAGVVWTGPLSEVIPDPDRRGDDVGIAVAYARLSQSPGAGFTRDFELSTELFYSLRLTRHLLVKPDVQYVVHPAYAPTKDAVVFSLRATVAF